MRATQFLFAFVLVASRVFAQAPAEWTQFNARQRDALQRERAAHGAPATVDSPFALLGRDFLRESNGTISVVGEIQNVTSITLTFAALTLTFSNGTTVLGSRSTFAFAPQNVRLQATGQYVGAMPPGSVAFFKAYTDIPFDSVRVSATGTAENFPFTPSAANVSVTAATVAPNGFGVSGRVFNSSARALTYLTQVAVAGYKNGLLADVAFTYVSGLTVPCGSVTSATGVGPGGTAPYNYFFLHPVASVGRAHVTWDEFALSATTATEPADGGAGALQVSANCPWTAASDASWIAIVAGASGTGDAILSYVVSPNPSATSRTGTITVKGIGFRITQAGSTGPVDTAAPFGIVDTPLDDATGVTGSLPVTGWALDDTGIAAIRIFRSPAGAEPPGQQIFVGNGVLVTGARPDVAAAYPSYPNSNRAGWGYLLLTNMLPNQGDGPFTLHVYAEDAAGRTTLLGSRRFTGANSTAITPFGTIDTPGQGQTVSGIVNNFGWVLSLGTTRADPPNGGTVNVFVDGVRVGSPSGWTRRSDLSALFPVAQYAGIDTALGVFPLDTSTLTNGVHTIAWAVTDNLGGAAGIGSRYFTVANGTALHLSPPTFGALRASHAGRPLPTGRRGPDLDAVFKALRRDTDGTFIFAAEELERIELRVGASSGGLRSATEALPLPIGSRIDPGDGTFTWQPGPGFIGSYDLVFDTSRGTQKVRVTLYPKGTLTRPQVVIDTPTRHEALPGSFVVAGWAVDPTAAVGPGIDAIHVWAYPVRGGLPIFAGAATLAGKRPDVAAIYGSNGLRSGYGIRVDALPPGSYDIAVFGWSSSQNGFLPAATVRVLLR